MERLTDLAGNLAHEHAQVVPLTLFVAVLCLCLVIGHLLEENRWVNESITAIIMGCVCGIFILVLSKGKSSHILRFNEELFFIYLLPPIIFNAGRWTFPGLGLLGLTGRDYLGVILLLVMIFSVLVFGEGVVNDATSVVLFNAIQKMDVTRLNSKTVLRVVGDFLYLFLTSTALGVTTGLVTAFILKTLYFGRHSSIREIALMVLMAYLSYMLAELLELSGILTVFFCGILMSHYAWHNVTESSRITTRHVFAMMSYVAETVIFLYVGMDALDIEKWRTSKINFGTSMSICSTLVMLVLLGRAAFVFPLSGFSNFMNRGRTSLITFKQQVIIWWAGLMRGAVSIALAYKQFTFSGVTSNPVNAAMVTTTIIVVLFTTMVFGFLTKPLIYFMLPHDDNNRNNHQEVKIPKDDVRLPLLSLEESAATNLQRATDSLSMLIESPVYTIHYYWKKFDNAYMRPIFGGPRSSQQEC
ncbi:sodium/hydrogen exchanger 4 isoform X4 [Ricinus communis]|uniref:sodium/hydrogen exchanger 4 isoform X4 n=1 Tax=Ricinus communis TaxID=3988 RepID=UPI00201AE85B|nr:sodium/hydrogen exchanger 4 isoform X4 [Ricinus communis]